MLRATSHMRLGSMAKILLLESQALLLETIVILNFFYFNFFPHLARWLANAIGCVLRGTLSNL
jgi:hypothetical protein